MKYEEQTNQAAENQLEGSFSRHHLLDRLSFIVGIALTPIFPVLLYSFTTNSLPNILTVERLAYFMAGLALFEIIIISVVDFIRRQNRGVILLQHRLAEIYLSALKKSALNPQTQSPTSDD